MLPRYTVVGNPMYHEDRITELGNGLLSDQRSVIDSIDCFSLRSRPTFSLEITTIKSDS